MISNADRSGWFGASDTAMIMGSWKTKTFTKWWAVKLGIMRNDFKNAAMLAGTHFEHRILDAIGVEKRDRQLKKRRLRLRVNLDGEDQNTVYEVKTHSGAWKLPKNYWQQVQVQMWVTGKKGCIIHYKMEPDDYMNYFNPIDPERLGREDIEPDREWIEKEYLPRLRILAQALKKGERPVEPERK